MRFSLTSHMGLQASSTQYYINCDAPVGLSLDGPNSYCYLKGIKNSQLKELLVKVGETFEKKAWGSFFNVHHIFAPTEVTENKSNEKLNDEINEDFENQVQVKDIFDIVKEAIAEQTNDSLVLDLTDVTKLIVKKAEDRSFMKPRRTYELEIRILEKVVKVAEESGLKFEKYGSLNDEDGPVYALGVGQTSLYY